VSFSGFGGESPCLFPAFRERIGQAIERPVRIVAVGCDEDFIRLIHKILAGFSVFSCKLSKRFCMGLFEIEEDVADHVAADHLNED